MSLRFAIFTLLMCCGLVLSVNDYASAGGGSGDDKDTSPNSCVTQFTEQSIGGTGFSELEITVNGQRPNGVIIPITMKDASQARGRRIYFISSTATPYLQFEPSDYSTEPHHIQIGDFQKEIIRSSEPGGDFTRYRYTLNVCSLTELPASDISVTETTSLNFVDIPLKLVVDSTEVPFVTDLSQISESMLSSRYTCSASPCALTGPLSTVPRAFCDTSMGTMSSTCSFTFDEITNNGDFTVYRAELSIPNYQPTFLSNWFVSQIPTAPTVEPMPIFSGAAVFTCGPTPAGENNPCDTDDDNDGAPDDSDNCPLVANSNQADIDQDGLGDACDNFDNRDSDNDSIPNGSDNCPNTSNSNQADIDEDGLGDACDNFDNRDSDNDSIPNGSDNCPNVANTDQADLDMDGIGSACDPSECNVVAVSETGLTSGSWVEVRVNGVRITDRVIPLIFNQDTQRVQIFRPLTTNPRFDFDRTREITRIDIGSVSTAIHEANGFGYTFHFCSEAEIPSLEQLQCPFYTVEYATGNSLIEIKELGEKSDILPERVIQLPYRNPSDPEYPIRTVCLNEDSSPYGFNPDDFYKLYTQKFEAVDFISGAERNLYTFYYCVDHPDAPNPDCIGEDTKPNPDACILDVYGKVTTPEIEVTPHPNYPHNSFQVHIKNLNPLGEATSVYGKDTEFLIECIGTNCPSRYAGYGETRTYTEVNGESVTRHIHYGTNTETWHSTESSDTGWNWGPLGGTPQGKGTFGLMQPGNATLSYDQTYKIKVTARCRGDNSTASFSEGTVSTARVSKPTQCNKSPDPVDGWFFYYDGSVDCCYCERRGKHYPKPSKELCEKSSSYYWDCRRYQ